MSDDVFDLGLDELQAEIRLLVSDLDSMSDEVDDGAIRAAQEAAEIIAAEQKRLLATACFQNGTADLSSLIRIRKASTKKYYRLDIGYDSQAVREHPEVLVIEYGRPGKSARRSKKTDSLGRKKGAFPPQTPHIIPGLILSRERAAEHFQNKLLEIARKKWERH